MQNILVITYWNYQDALIQTYTLPYLRIIKTKISEKDKIFLITLEKDISIFKNGKREAIEGKLVTDGIVWLPFNYYRFGLKSVLNWMWIFSKITGLIFRNKISIIHCWATPAGAIGYVLSLLLNKKLILDSYEPHAESMVENGTWQKNSLAYRILFWFEKKQSKRASSIIATTEGMRDYALKKYNVRIRNFHVKPACVDLKLFSFHNIKNEKLILQLNLRAKIVCVYAGKFGGIYLEHEVFDFFKSASAFWGDSFRALILTSHSRVEIEGFCKQAGVSHEIVLSFYAPHSEIPRYMGLADFAITPVKPVPSKRFCSPIKDGEYWALGLPVIIPQNISDDSEIIERYQIGAVLKEFNETAYKNAFMKIDQLLLLPKKETFERIRFVARKYRSFEVAETVYSEVYASKN